MTFEKTEDKHFAITHSQPAAFDNWFTQAHKNKTQQLFWEKCAAHKQIKKLLSETKHEMTKMQQNKIYSLLQNLALKTIVNWELLRRKNLIN